MSTQELTKKDRLDRAIIGEEIDRPPFICPGGMMNMAVTDAMDESGATWPEAHHDAETMATLTHVAAQVTGIENLGLPFCMTVEAEGLGAPIEFGTRETEPRVAEYLMEDLSELDHLGSFDAHAGRSAVVSDAVRSLVSRDKDDRLPVVVCLTGPISLATSLIEPLTFYRALRKDPAGAHALLEIATEAALRFGDALIDAGADVVCIADPSATGELLGRPAFERFAAPYVNDLTRHFEQRGVQTIVHVCGDVRSLKSAFGDLAAPTLSIDSMVRVDQAIELAPGKTLMGNISTYLLEYGKPSSVAKVAENCHRLGAQIISPACGIGARTPAANLRAGAEAVRGLDGIVRR